MAQDNNDVEPKESADHTPASAPTGKRQLTGSSTTSGQAYARKRAEKESEVKKEHTVLSFLPEVFAEMKKVIWPSARQMLNYTVIVFLFLIVLTAIIYGVDFLTAKGVSAVLTQ